MKRILLVLGLAVATTASAQLYRIELLLEFETVGTFGSPEWTSMPVDGRSHVTLYYDPSLPAEPAAPGEAFRRYRSNRPEANRVYFGDMNVAIEELVVTDTALQLNFFDASTNTRLDLDLVFLAGSTPDYALPRFDPGYEEEVYFPNFGTRQWPSEIPGAPAVGTVSFSTDGGFGFTAGGYRAELNEVRYHYEEMPEPPAMTPVPEPATYAVGALLVLGGGVAWRRRSLKDRT